MQQAIVPVQSNVFYPSQRAYLTAKTYLNDLTSLYNQYVIDETIKKLLKDKIERTNIAIEKYIDYRENSYLLFCETNFDKAINHSNSLKENSEFLLNAFTFIYRSTRDRDLKKLLISSVNVLQKFIIKLSDFIDINTDLKNFSGEIDEDSEEYNNKMGEIIDHISSKSKVKTGNSLRETLGL